MWLIYLRFDDNNQVVTQFVICPNKVTVGHIITLADQHGLTESARLVEYESFYSSGTIKANKGPNSTIYHHTQFVSRWERVENSRPKDM